MASRSPRIAEAVAGPPAPGPENATRPRGVASTSIRLSTPSVRPSGESAGNAVGNAGNISAYWAGFSDYARAGITSTRPRMLGFQAAGAAPIVLGRPVERPETVATAIRIGNPASWSKALAARDESGGRIEAVTDEEILSAYGDLARLDGVFCEPASAASVAGIAKLARAGELDAQATIVCVLTGSGLKDPQVAEAQVGPILEAPASLAGVASALGW